jgi:putative ABC transport system permease protein
VIDRELGADVLLASPHALPPDAGDRLRAIPGVGRVALWGFGQAAVVGSPSGGGEQPAGASVVPTRVPLSAIDPDEYFRLADLAWSSGDRNAARQALERGGAVLLSRPLADSLGLAVGDVLRLRAVDGPPGAEDAGRVVELRVAATFTSLAGTGAVLSLADAAGGLAMAGRNSALVDIEPGRTDEVLRAIGEAFPAAQLSRIDRIRDEARAQMLSLFGIGYGALFGAALLCTIGLGANMSASILRREQEIRLLRSVGATPGQTVRALCLEATIMVGLGLIAALPLGWIESQVLLDLFRRMMAIDLTARVPVAFLVLYPLAIVPLAAVATILPARRASRISLTAGQ